MADPKPSFWSTMPGLFTAVGGILTALTGLITALHGAGIIDFSSARAPKPPAQVNAGAHQPSAAHTPPLEDRLAGSYSLASINGIELQGEMKITRASRDAFRFNTRMQGTLAGVWYDGEITRRSDGWYVHIQGTNDPSVLRLPVANQVTFEGNLLTFRNPGAVVVWTKF